MSGASPKSKPSKDQEAIVSMVSRARNGDADALVEIYDRFKDMALNYARSLVGDSDLAEDARQEAFISAYCDLMSLQEPAAFPFWFKQIVKRKSLTIKRDGAKRLTVPLDDHFDQKDSAPTVAENLTVEQRDAAIRREVRRLPVNERGVIEQYYLLNKSVRDTSEVLNIPEKKVKSRLHTARQRLRDRLHEELTLSIGAIQQNEMSMAIKDASRVAIEAFDTELGDLLRLPRVDELDRTIELLCGKGRLLRMLGEVEQARESFENAAAVLNLSKRPELLARLLGELAYSHLAVCDARNARSEFNAALKIMARKSTPALPPLSASLRHGLALCDWVQGKREESRKGFEQALAEAEADDCCEELRAEALNNLALIDWDEGDFDRARERLTESRAFWKKANVSYGVCSVTLNLGTVADLTGDTADARKHYRAALKSARHHGYDTLEVSALTNLGWLDYARNSLKQAQERTDEAIAIARRVDDARGLCVALENAALIAAAQSRFDDARACSDEGVALANKREDADTQFSLELARLEVDKLSESEEEFRVGLGNAKSALKKHPRQRARLARIEAESLAGDGKSGAARKAAERGLKAAEATKNLREQRLLEALITALETGE